MPKPPRPAPARHLSSLKPQVRLDPGKLKREKEAHLKEREKKRVEDSERAQLAAIAEKKAMEEAEAKAAAPVASGEETIPPSEPPSEEAEAPAEEPVAEEAEVDAAEVDAAEVDAAEEPIAEEHEEEPPADPPAAASEEPPPAEAKEEKAPEAAPEEPAADGGKTEADIPALLEGTNTAITVELATGAWDKLLKSVLAAETSGKNRRGAKEAIEARIASLG